MALRLIDARLLADLSAQAQQSPRRRRHHNFHPADDFPAHRLLNALEPGTYVPPHRHLDPAKAETMVLLAGRLGLVLFDPQGAISATHRLAAGGDCLGVDIPPGTWHSVLALAPGTVILEAKAGPYRPLAPAELAPWAPREESPEAPAYLAGLAALFRD